MAEVQIKRTSNVVSVDPQILNVSSNDFVIFTNLDPQSEHRPTQAGQAADWWLNFPIAAFVEGQDPDSSAAITLPASGAAAVTIQYVIDAGSSIGGSIVIPATGQ